MNTQTQTPKESQITFAPKRRSDRGPVQKAAGS
jgi:hypothetical protein